MARTRSHKRRPTGARRTPPGANGAAPTGRVEREERTKQERTAAASTARTKRVRTSPAAPTYGERPRAPWHPLPLSELLILVGAVGAALGLARSSHGLTGGGRLLLAGLGAVALGTIEVTWREHRTGHRSHTVMLTALVVLVVDSVVVLVLTAVTSLPRVFDVGLLAADVALFAVFFKLLRARFVDARHARVLREG